MWCLVCRVKDFERSYGSKSVSQRVNTQGLAGLGMPHPDGSAHVGYRYKIGEEKIEV